MSLLFKVKDAFLGHVKLREDNGIFKLFVGNREIQIKKGKRIGSGMNVGEGVENSVMGEWEKSWRSHS